MIWNIDSEYCCNCVRIINSFQLFRRIQWKWGSFRSYKSNKEIHRIWGCFDYMEISANEWTNLCIAVNVAQITCQLLSRFTTICVTCMYSSMRHVCTIDPQQPTQLLTKKWHSFELICQQEFCVNDASSILRICPPNSYKLPEELLFNQTITSLHLKIPRTVHL